ncbi:MAG: PAS domain-containing protein [Candidatus Muirbacterium halophilum]|nr:PAS domain-containing protein [Candidatus Muirbacterium halophilum]
MSLLIALFNATFIFCNRKRNNIQNKYLLISFSLILWIFFYILLRLFVIHQNLSVFFRMGSVFWLFIGIAVFEFSHTIINKKSYYLKKILYIIYIIAIFISIFSDKVTKQWNYNKDNELTIVFGNYYPVFMIFLIILPILYSVFILLRNYKTEKDYFIKIQSGHFLLGAFFVVIISLFTDTIIPFYIKNPINLSDKTMIYIFIYNLYILIIMLKYGFLSRESDLYYYNIFDIVEDAVAIADELGFIIKANKAFKDIFPKNLLNENLFDFLNINLKVNYSEFQYSKKFYKLNIVEIDNDNKNTLLKMIIIKDISFYRDILFSLPELSKINKNVEYSYIQEILDKVIYEIIFKAENFPVVIFDKNTGDIINVNPSFSVVAGISDLNFQNMNFADFLKDKSDYEIIKKNIEEKNHFSDSFYIIDNNLNSILSEISFSFVNEEYEFIIAVFREESRILNIEREILKNERLSEFSMITSGISHDYNNFNTVISGYIEIISRISNNLYTKEILKDINILVEKIVKLTSSIRLIFGNDGINKEIVNIKEIFYIVFDILKIEFDLNNIDIKINIDKNHFVFIEKNILPIILLAIFDKVLDNRGNKTNKKIIVNCMNENSAKIIELELINFAFEEKEEFYERYDYLKNILKKLGGLIIFKQDYNNKKILIKVPLYI